jgi:hypothetical protein
MNVQAPWPRATLVVVPQVDTELWGDVLVL